VADSQNAHHPDKTQPLDAMPAAPKPAPAQMELLKPGAPDEPTHSHDKTQPLHIIPPTSLAPPVDAAKSPQVDAANTSAVPAAPASQPSANTSVPPGAVPATPPLRPEVAKPVTTSATVPPRQAITRPLATQVVTSPPAQPSVSASPLTPVEPVKPTQPSVTPSHSEPAKAPPLSAPKDYVKTVAMMAASPPPASASTPSAEPIAPPDIEQLRPKASSPVGDRFRWIGHKIATTALVAEILPGAAAKLRAYGALTRLNKPIGIWLLLWPVLWALWLSSGGKPDPHVFIVFVLGTVLTRSAGCAINDFADRKFDGHVKRTKDRPLVTGAVDPVEAIALCAGLGLIALGLALTLNQLAQQLALVGGVLVLTYPFFKRFFPLPQAYLGIAFTWSVPMAYAAQTGAVPRSAIVMFMAGLLWTVAYDTMYAMVDREDDKKLGIRSSALLFGDADRFIIGIMQLMTLLGLWLIGDEMELGLWYGLGLAFAAMFALYQQLLIRKRKPEDCFKAFLNNNYFGMSVFIGIVLEYTFR
jgi:4-hydroxybenzoate polyprenyltransferase